LQLDFNQLASSMQIYHLGVGAISSAAILAVLVYVMDSNEYIVTGSVAVPL